MSAGNPIQAILEAAYVLAGCVVMLTVWMGFSWWLGRKSRRDLEVAEVAE